jgi:hypothetical protein
MWKMWTMLKLNSYERAAHGGLGGNAFGGCFARSRAAAVLPTIDFGVSHPAREPPRPARVELVRRNSPKPPMASQESALHSWVLQVLRKWWSLGDPPRQRFLWDKSISVP